MGKTFKRKARVQSAWAREMRHRRNAVREWELERSHPSMRGALPHWDGQDMADHKAELRSERDWQD